MTPQWPKPSMHDVASGYFVPTLNDSELGLEFGFGLTTNILNGQSECGNSSEENSTSLKRIRTFKKLLEVFGLPQEDESTMGCKD